MYQEVYEANIFGDCAFCIQSEWYKSYTIS